MHHRIIDRRTGKAVDYRALLKEAEEIAAGDPKKLPTACREVAQQASEEQWDSIERRLRKYRQVRLQEISAGSQPDQPIPGYGVFARDLGRFAEQLEAALNEATNRQEFSAHRVRLIETKARRLYGIAEERFDYLESVDRETAEETIRPFLRELEESDQSMSPAAFIDSEHRQLQLILIICSRVLNKTRGYLEFL